MTNKIKVAAYCRVSTDMEDQLHSLSAQIKYFTEYISNHEDYELIEVYYDEGITGTSTKKRDGFNRMIADAELGKINLILTKEVSRFARNTIDTLSYTRKLKACNVNILFMNDGIDTRDKDSELRLTIMASLAQEESRKISDRTKWGMRRKMESGYVLGTGRIYGFIANKDKLEIVPEEAEVVKRIFYSYLYEKKGTTLISKDLNADKIPTLKGGMWSAPTLLQMLRNEKYCGNLTQWKYRTTDFLTHNTCKNKNENAEEPLITIDNHHEGIVSKEVFDAVQAELERRSSLFPEKRKYSGTYWFSSKVVCGKCGKPFNVSGGKSALRRNLRCTNRAVYGKIAQADHNGEIRGCDNGTTNETVLAFGVMYILQQIRASKKEIEKDLLSEIRYIQDNRAEINIAELKGEIEKLRQKKRNAIDLVLDGLISKEDLSEQNSYYDSQILSLTEKISTGLNMDETHRQQLAAIQEYIKQVRQAETLDIENRELYREITKRIVVQEYRTIDYYLNCVPFGFRFVFHLKKPGKGRTYAIVPDSCTVLQ